MDPFRGDAADYGERGGLQLRLPLAGTVPAGSNARADELRALACGSPRALRQAAARAASAAFRERMAEVGATARSLPDRIAAERAAAVAGLRASVDASVARLRDASRRRAAAAAAAAAAREAEKPALLAAGQNPYAVWHARDEAARRAREADELRARRDAHAADVEARVRAEHCAAESLREKAAAAAATATVPAASRAGPAAVAAARRRSAGAVTRVPHSLRVASDADTREVCTTGGDTSSLVAAAATTARAAAAGGHTSSTPTPATAVWAATPDAYVDALTARTGNIAALQHAQLQLQVVQRSPGRGASLAHLAPDVPSAVSAAPSSAFGTGRLHRRAHSAVAAARLHWERASNRGNSSNATHAAAGDPACCDAAEVNALTDALLDSARGKHWARGVVPEHLLLPSTSAGTGTAGEGGCCEQGAAATSTPATGRPQRAPTVYEERLRARARGRQRALARLDVTAGRDELTGLLPPPPLPTSPTAAAAGSAASPTFIASPPLVEFVDFTPQRDGSGPGGEAPQRSYTARLRLTRVGVGDGLCGVRLLPPPAALADVLRWEYAHPGRMTRGATCEVTVVFTPRPLPAGDAAAAAASLPLPPPGCDDGDGDSSTDLAAAHYQLCDGGGGDGAAPAALLRRQLAPYADVLTELVVVPERGPLTRVPVLCTTRLAVPCVSATQRDGPTLSNAVAVTRRQQPLGTSAVTAAQTAAATSAAPPCPASTAAARVRQAQDARAQLQPLHFGGSSVKAAAVVVGDAATRVLRLRNLGALPVTATAAVTGEGAGDVALAVSDCGSGTGGGSTIGGSVTVSVPPFGAVALALTYTPRAPGEMAALLSVSFTLPAVAPEAVTDGEGGAANGSVSTGGPTAADVADAGVITVQAASPLQRALLAPWHVPLTATAAPPPLYITAAGSGGDGVDIDASLDLGTCTVGATVIGTLTVHNRGSVGMHCAPRVDAALTAALQRLSPSPQAPPAVTFKPASAVVQAADAGTGAPGSHSFELTLRLPAGLLSSEAVAGVGPAFLVPVDTDAAAAAAPAAAPAGDDITTSETAPAAPSPTTTDTAAAAVVSAAAAVTSFRLRVPVTATARDQALPVHAVLTATVTPAHLVLEPPSLAHAFGTGYPGVPMAALLRVRNASGLPQRYAFKRLPPWVLVAPAGNHGTGVLQPGECAALDVVVCPPLPTVESVAMAAVGLAPTALAAQLTLTTSTHGRYDVGVGAALSARNAHPPVTLASPPVAALPPLAPGETVEATFHLRNTCHDGHVTVTALAPVAAAAAAAAGGGRGDGVIDAAALQAAVTGACAGTPPPSNPLRLPGGLTFSVSPSTALLAPGEAVAVTVSVSRDAAPPLLAPAADMTVAPADAASSSLAWAVPLAAEVAAHPPPTPTTGAVAGDVAFSDAGATRRVDGVVVAHVTTSLVVAGVTVEPPALDFGRVRVGATAQRSVTVRNGGTRPFSCAPALVLLPGVTAAGPFGICTSGSPVTLAPGESREVQLTFSPTAAPPPPPSLPLAAAFADADCGGDGGSAVGEPTRARRLWHCRLAVGDASAVQQQAQLYLCLRGEAVVPEVTLRRGGGSVSSTDAPAAPAPQTNAASPTATPPPLSVDFGAALVGHPVAAAFTLTNASDFDVPFSVVPRRAAIDDGGCVAVGSSGTTGISEVTQSAPPPLFVWTPSAGTLPPHSEAALKLTFAPDAAAAAAAAAAHAACCASFVVDVPGLPAERAMAVDAAGRGYDVPAYVTVAAVNGNAAATLSMPDASALTLLPPAERGVIDIVFPLMPVAAAVTAAATDAVVPPQAGGKGAKAAPPASSAGKAAVPPPAPSSERAITVHCIDTLATTLNDGVTAAVAAKPAAAGKGSASNSAAPPPSAAAPAAAGGKGMGGAGSSSAAADGVMTYAVALPDTAGGRFAAVGATAAAAAGGKVAPGGSAAATLRFIAPKPAAGGDAGRGASGSGSGGGGRWVTATATVTLTGRSPGRADNGGGGADFTRTVALRLCGWEAPQS
jgi:hypothetical protein